MAARIGIVSQFDVERGMYACDPAYVRAIEAAGGLPVLVPYLGSGEVASRLLDVLDGMLLTGGTDFPPSLYGEPMHPAVGPIIQERDAFEFRLVRLIFERDVPVLGICRGLQCLNVAAGGSLYSDLASCLPTALEHRDAARETVHPVRLGPNSRLARLAGVSELEVNSRHHQAIKTLGLGFRASGHAPDGVIEAIESDIHRFAIGVQWHPEDLWEADRSCLRLFEGFVEACARRAEEG